MVDAPPKTWLLPPGLKCHFEMFIHLYDTVFKNPAERRRPLLIHGNPGVGKTMFTQAFETLYRRDNSAKPSDVNVKRVNVSAMPETLFESEFFGYKRGAFTGATSDKQGFVENTDLLVLEEIGELSKPTQAKLLTFMEDGIYYRVGDTSPRKSSANIQIVATTNTPLDTVHFRKDFLDRCYIFHVPALHERRGDILYTLLYQNPDTLRALIPWQILALLSYHWPGNMRELEKFGKTALMDYFIDCDINTQNAVLGSAKFCQTDFFDPELFSNLEDRLTDIENYEGIEILRNLEPFFIKSHVSTNNISRYNDAIPIGRPAFKNITQPKVSALNPFTDVYIINKIDEFVDADNAMRFFANMQCVKYTAPISLINPPTITGSTDHFWPYLMIPDYGPVFHEALDVLGKIFLQSQNYARSFHPEEARKTKEHSSFSIETETDFLISYYSKLLIEANSNVAEVARRSGVNRKTLDNKLINLGIHPTRKKRL